MDTALMNHFSAYAEPVVIVFGVVVLLALLSAVMLYSSYYLGGRSIYDDALHGVRRYVGRQDTLKGFVQCGSPFLRHRPSLLSGIDIA